MPHLIYHRRRHSWPYCGPGKRPLPIIKVSAPEEEQRNEEHKNHFLTSLVSENDGLFDDTEDDAAYAGIVRSSSPRSHHHLLWPHASSRSATISPDEQYNLSGTSRGASGSLRRIIRPPLDKARSLFAVPTTTAAGEKVLISYLVSRQPNLSQSTDVTKSGEAERGRRLNDNDPRLLGARRNHRRCHSEQPRSWREPSASLWTLLEE